MSNQVHNSDFHMGMTNAPYWTIGQAPTELISANDWCEFYRLEAERYQAMVNLPYTSGYK